MNILIAEDDHLARALLERTLRGNGHEVVVACDGASAWDILQQPNSPKLAILDWMMPKLDGVEVCQRVRNLNRSEPTYLILLTARDRTADVIVGLNSGANDFVTKPCDREELCARVRVGERVTTLQRLLAEKVRALEEASLQLTQLRVLLPICTYCRNVRDDQNYWQQVESYLAAHSDVRFTHGICPDCYQSVVMPQLTAFGIELEAGD